MFDPFTIERFLPHVGEVFHVITDDARHIHVLLSEVTRLGTACTRPRTREPFSLMFHAPAGSTLVQNMYRLENPALEPFDCFLVPIGPDRFGMRFEAIYT